MNGFDIATVGDNCIDQYLLPVGVSTVGGNAVNVAVHLRRRGHRVAYLGAVGNDANGERLLACLDENGVATGHVRVRPGRTAVTELASDPMGDRIIVSEDFGVCRGYRPAAAEVEGLRSRRHVHLGWIDDEGALKRALVADGVSVSQDLTVNAPDKHRKAEGLTIAFLSAGPSRQRAQVLMREALELGASIVVVTCGALGSIASDGVITAETGISPVSVVDTTGAGDTFIAAFLDAHIRVHPLQRCLEAGRDAAAETCTHIGGFPTTASPGPEVG